MTVENYYAKYRLSQSKPIKSYGVKSIYEMVNFSQLKDDRYKDGLRHCELWNELKYVFPLNSEVNDNDVSYYTGLFLGYNKIDWITEDELDELVPYIKTACRRGFGRVGKVIAYFGGIRSKDKYWLKSFCSLNGFRQSLLLPYYKLGTKADLDKEFETLDRELANEY